MMNEKKPLSQSNEKAGAVEKDRKPYEKPMIVYRQPLEARASICNPGAGGKSDATCTVAFS
ncbi:MAG: hypothetical protein D6723_05225, partial [Acidobacteria bacterium]